MIGGPCGAPDLPVTPVTGYDLSRTIKKMIAISSSDIGSIWQSPLLMSRHF